jgi:hypothetical protein
MTSFAEPNMRFLSFDYIFDISPSDVRRNVKNNKIKYRVKGFVFTQIVDKYGVHHMIDCKICRSGDKYDDTVSLVKILEDMSYGRLKNAFKKIDNLISDNVSRKSNHSWAYLNNTKILILNEIKRRKYYSPVTSISEINANEQ